MIAVPSRVLKRARSQIEKTGSAFEHLPYDVLLQISKYTDLFTLVNIVRCSIRLAMQIYDGHLLDLDPDNLSTTEKAFVLDSIPLEFQPAGFKRYRFHSAPSGGRRLPVRPSGIACKLCDYDKHRDSSSRRSYEKAWFRHLRIEVENNGGRVPRRMVSLLYLAMRSLEEEYNRKLERAALLRLNVPGLPESQDKKCPDQKSEADSSDSEADSSDAKVFSWDSEVDSSDSESDPSDSD